MALVEQAVEDGSGEDVASDEGREDCDDGVAGLPKRGRSKGSRLNLAQVVIGFAVPRDGIPVRCWVWPGEHRRRQRHRGAKRDLDEWKLGRVILVLDAGFNSEANRRMLQGAGDASDPWSAIVGER